MPTLTRRRSADHRHKCWHIYYGDVHVGTIVERVSNPCRRSTATLSGCSTRRGKASIGDAASLRGINDGSTRINLLPITLEGEARRQAMP
jgi:hypothetical protein